MLSFVLMLASFLLLVVNQASSVCIFEDEKCHMCTTGGQNRWSLTQFLYNEATTTTVFTSNIMFVSTFLYICLGTG